MKTVSRTTIQVVFKNENYISLLDEMSEYFKSHMGYPNTDLMEDTTIVFDNASQSYIATVYCLTD